MKLELLSTNNLDEIFNFETINKDFFEKSLPPRSSNYYDYTEFIKIMNEIIVEQYERKCFMFIIKDHSNNVIGRINIISEDCKNFELGYRLGENSIGKGYGSEAVKQLINVAFNDCGAKKLSHLHQLRIYLLKEYY